MKMRELVVVHVDEWIVSVIKAMYKDVITATKINGRVRRCFFVKVDVHQGSALFSAGGPYRHSSSPFNVCCPFLHGLDGFCL